MSNKTAIAQFTNEQNEALTTFTRILNNNIEVARNIIFKRGYHFLSHMRSKDLNDTSTSHSLQWAVFKIQRIIEFRTTDDAVTFSVLLGKSSHIRTFTIPANVFFGSTWDQAKYYRAEVKREHNYWLNKEKQESKLCNSTATAKLALDRLITHLEDEKESLSLISNRNASKADRLSAYRSIAKKVKQDVPSMEKRLTESLDDIAKALSALEK